MYSIPEPVQVLLVVGCFNLSMRVILSGVNFFSLFFLSLEFWLRFLVDLMRTSGSTEAKLQVIFVPLCPLFVQGFFLS